MNYRIFLSSRFDRDSHTKEIVRSYFNKSYDRFYDFLEKELDSFDAKKAISIGKNLYKTDLSPPRFNKGKRKAYRLIFAYFQVKNVVTPVIIYKKSILSNLPKAELVLVLEEIVEEMDELKKSQE